MSANAPEPRKHTVSVSLIISRHSSCSSLDATGGGRTMGRQPESEILAEVVALLAKSRALMRKGEYNAAERVARQAIKLREQLVDAECH